MKNRAFTLVELLGVIILISLITLLVLPKITSAVRNKKQSVNKVNEKIIFAATDLYLKDNYDLDTIESGTQVCIEISTLEEENYLKETMDIYEKQSISNKAVLAEYDNGFSYTLYDSLNECNTNISD